MGTLESLSNVTSLTGLVVDKCGHDLRREGLGRLLTAGGQLRELEVRGSPRFFAGWDPNQRRSVTQNIGGADVYNAEQPYSSISKLHGLSDFVNVE
jgi:hypothetical protein